ncbi:hypothetical protein VTK26DRAFT_349 [Humicola hyalothermophila]
MLSSVASNLHLHSGNLAPHDVDGLKTPGPFVSCLFIVPRRYFSRVTVLQKKIQSTNETDSLHTHLAIPDFLQQYNYSTCYWAGQRSLSRPRPFAPGPGLPTPQPCNTKAATMQTGPRCGPTWTSWRTCSWHCVTCRTSTLNAGLAPGPKGSTGPEQSWARISQPRCVLSRTSRASTVSEPKRRMSFPVTLPI